MRTHGGDNGCGLLLDEMYPPSLAAALRARGHDVVAVLDTDVGLAACPDHEVLAWAAADQRCLITENVRDFAQLSPHLPHAGIVFASSRRFPRTRSGLARLDAALDALLSDGRLPPKDAIAWLDAAI